ncbi:MAG: hypothetical protein GXY53_09695 [Desulfobulbus sp.]|nr:hypothetical protein [Desulfobulbus sp.]
MKELYEGSVNIPLTETLREFGQTIPLLVLQKNETAYQLLANFAVFQSLNFLEVSRLYCRVLPCTLQPYRRYSLQVLHGWNELQESPILRAHLLQQAGAHCTSEELLSLLSLMGLPPQRHMADELVSLLSLSAETISALHHGFLALKSAKLMFRLSHQDQKYVVKILKRYKPGGSKQYKLIEMITELTRRMNVPVANLVQKWLPSDQDSVSDNSPQQLQNILRELIRLCWPEKTKLDEQFLQFVHSLSLPKNISVTPSSSYEEESCSLCIHFASADELRNMWDKIHPLFSTTQGDC